MSITRLKQSKTKSILDDKIASELFLIVLQNEINKEEKDNYTVKIAEKTHKERAFVYKKLKRLKEETGIIQIKKVRKNFKTMFFIDWNAIIRIINRTRNDLTKKYTKEIYELKCSYAKKEKKKKPDIPNYIEIGKDDYVNNRVVIDFLKKFFWSYFIVLTLIQKPILLNELFKTFLKFARFTNEKINIKSKNSKIIKKYLDDISLPEGSVLPLEIGMTFHLFFDKIKNL